MNNIEQILIDKGYRKYPSGISFKYSDYFYQKCFKDDKGKKYFIEFIYYSPIKFSNENTVEENFMCHLNINEPHMTFEQHHIKDVEEAEKKCELFFNIMGCNYYERFEENS
jgi:hypothetical protein